jgi:hypothetical protein
MLGRFVQSGGGIIICILRMRIRTYEFDLRVLHQLADKGGYIFPSLSNYFLRDLRDIWVA